MKETYASWAEYLSDLFGLSSEADTRMVRRWVDEYRDEGYSPAELVEATRIVFRGERPPRYKTEIPAALAEALRFLRRQQVEEKQQAQREELQAQVDPQDGLAVWRRFRQGLDQIGKMPNN